MTRNDEESRAGEPEPAKKKAEENEWYLLATLYDRPGVRRPVENRNAWNQYFAANLDDETRAKLIKEERYTKEELTPFSSEDLQKIEKDFGVRARTPRGSLPKAIGSSISRIFNSMKGSGSKNFFSLTARSRGRFSPARASTKPHSPDRSTSRKRRSMVRPISLAQPSAKLSLWERKRIFLAQSSFLRLLSMALLFPGMFTLTARYSRMRPNSWQRLSQESSPSRA